MNFKERFLASICVLFIISIQAQETTTTTVSATSTDISLNLDLEAVASVFGESKDLEDFETRLNNPESKISNLDLNEDGNVDYLRVLEVSEDHTHVVTIQSVLAENEYQDVATIDVEKSGEDTQVIITGDAYIYGPNYFISPYFGITPPIFGWFWGPMYNPWMSPWYWGFYPPYFSPWRPFPPHIYHNNVHGHINAHNRYNHDHVKRNHNAKRLQKSVSHKDFQKKNPGKSFAKRNAGMTNKRDINLNNNAKFNRTNSKNFNRTSTRPFTSPTRTRSSFRPSSMSRSSGRFGGFRR
ncbi:hypothetical protein [Formosa algae]|uniref:DUF3300 domain-containing protein n=1 Tax=Formosa algae TaxID=225843 RepID=A0A9X0YI56_9FLAO|nr:hypothetical protein [Formosa algae]MBP1838213.1 hypothetical protein [Formosa algae]MDQ0334348.1 hypothetical protein [Formosa algae]OEI80703.1 hypothetical protein AST99_07780 [Formosa algae]